MQWRVALARLRGLFGRRGAQFRLDAEIEAHLAMLAEEFERQGLAPEAARLAARREFGGVAQVRESWREQRGLPFFDALAQDLRYALRQIRQHARFACTAVATLALGIGANTLIYQVLDAVVYHPLPVRAPHQLQILKIAEDGRPVVGDQISEDFSYPLFRAMAARQDAAESLFASGFGGQQHEPGSSANISVSLVSGNYFTGIGAGAALGRVLTPEDDRVEAPAAGVISHRFWEKRFAARPQAIGQILQLGHTAVTVVGVAPAEFFGSIFGLEPDVWLPTSLQPRIMPVNWLHDDSSTWLNVMARLKPGVSPQRAQAALEALYRTQPHAEHHHLSLLSGYRGIPMLQDRLETLGWGGMVLVTVILLIACCNLATLVLSRGVSRTHEIGVRLALGAARGRIVRQLLTESVTLAIAGSLAAVALASWVWPVISSFAYLALPAPPGLGWHAMLFSGAIAAGALCLFGLAPAMAATRLDLHAALQDNRRTYSGGRSSGRLGRVLMAAQISVSVLLVYGAALLGRSLWNIEHQDFGFRTERLLLANFEWDQADASASERLHEDPLAAPLLDRLNRLPGVVSAALCAFGPLSNASETGTLSTPERSSPAENDVLVVHVSARYFETMGTPVLRGRAIDDRDRAGLQRVVVLSQSEARRLFGNTDPIGRLVSKESRFERKDAMTVIGVVRDIRFSGPRDTAGALSYVPLAQEPAPVTSIAVLTAGDAAAGARAVTEAMKEAAPSRRVARVEPVSDTLDDAMINDQLLAFLGGMFGVLALALTAVGMYGVISYGMACRTRELGIRLALGATGASMARLVAGEHALIVAGSAAVGAVAALAAARLLRGTLFGVAPGDPVLLLSAAVVLIAVAALAGWLPTRRVVRLDPMETLR